MRQNARHSGTQTSDKFCVFCGATGQGVVTREHVLPDWLNNHIVVRSDIGLESWRASGQLIETKERRGKLFARRPWIACKKCNNGWMGKLESEAIPLLKPMLDGRTIGVGFWEQATLATWAVKTCLALQWARHDINSLVPERHFREIAAKRGATPPRDVEVFLGYMRNIPVEQDRRYHALAYSARKRDVESDNSGLENANTYLLTLRVYHVVFQVVGSQNVPEDLGPWIHPYEPLHILRIWPRASVVANWPPPGAVEEREGGFNLLASRPEQWD
jgi:hypothetical protein